MEASRAESRDVEMAQVAPPFENTVEQLVDQCKLLRSQGKLEDHPDVVRLRDRIKEQQQARFAQLPGHVRAERAEKEVKRCRAQMEANEKKAGKLRSAAADC